MSEQKVYSMDYVRRLSKYALENPEKFWYDKMYFIDWFEKPKKVLEGKPPEAHWFIGGKMNISYNAIDRHIPELKDKVAFYWLNEKGDSKAISYYNLYIETNRAAKVLKDLGVKPGDAVSLMMPSIPEAVYFSFAIHRLGGVLAIHYLGLSEETLAYRFQDSGSKVLVVASKAFRNGQEIRVKDFVDKVLGRYTTPIEKVLVVSRGFSDFNVVGNRDIVYEDVIPRERVYIEPQPVDADSPGTIYYTSGTTGRPKGITQTNGSYVIALNWAFKGLMDPKLNEVWWTISELGWPVWPMANLYTIPVMGLTGVLFEGYVGYKRDLFARIVEIFNVNLIWSSTTTLYTLKALGDESVSGNLDSLRLILNTGEPLNVGAWRWLTEKIPDVKIGDAYWMTEHLLPIAATPFGIGEIPYKPGAAGITFPGSGFMVVDDDGRPLPPRNKGYIVLYSINPAMGRMWNDLSNERIVKTYWSRFPGYFYTGDYGYTDEDGYLYVLGRADDVIKATGERIGTLEVENIIATHPAVAECATVGYPAEGGEKLLAFVVLKRGYQPSEELLLDIKNYARNAGYIVDKIIFLNRLPKTKSGKIMRRLLRALMRNEPYGDISTLDDIKVLEEIREALKETFKQ